jgi:hypothetical protein
VTVILLVVSAVLLFVSLWIVIPAPNTVLLVFGVGAPEMSPALCAASIVSLVLAAILGAGVLGRIAMVLSIGAVVLTSLPIIRFAASVDDLDAAMRDGLPHVQLHGAFDRTSRFSLRDFVFGVSTASVRVTRGIVFAQPGSQSLSLDVYRPMDAANHPVVVQLYGGAWQRGAPGDNETFARWLASRGYTVFAIDYRHAPRWQWPAQRDDVQAALAWIATHAGEHGGDASRLALIGRSAGAQLALVAAYTNDAPKVSAVVSFYGPTDLPEAGEFRRGPIRCRSVRRSRCISAERRRRWGRVIARRRRSATCRRACRRRCSSMAAAITSSRHDSAASCTNVSGRQEPSRSCLKSPGPSTPSICCPMV